MSYDIIIARPPKVVDKDGPQPKKMLFVGDERVGKTTFIKTYLEYHRNTHHLETFEGDFLIFKQHVFYRPQDDSGVQVQLLDLPAGTTPQMRLDQYPSSVKAIVLCFTVDDRNSMTHIQQSWLPEIRRYYRDTIRFYLLGLRTDLRERREVGPISPFREPVSPHRGTEFHSQLGFYGQYMECSATENPQTAITLMQRIISEMFILEDRINPPVQF